MRKHSELMNVCLVTNRGCNLRCEHCYIEPELLASKSHISDETFKLIYQRTIELVKLDKRTYRVNVESLGGEPTFIPYEFWERNLPFSMQMAEELRVLTDKKAAFAFCSNMIISDHRYYDLFKRYSKNPNFELFIPWEPDTKRFGTRNKLYKKYEHSLLELKDSFKTLSLIPTKELISLGVDYIVQDHILKHKFNDVSTDMLYQFGSGKDFFDKNMPLFSEVSQWYIDLVEAMPEGVTVSPYEEVRQSLTLGVPYHCMGNDHFDVEIEPDGTTSLNSSMTGTEAQMPSRPLNVIDDNWAIKLLFENTIDLDLKLNGSYDFCRQCEFQRFCLGGYYHYKLLDKSVMDVLTQDGEGDCPGYKKFWQHVSIKNASEISPIYELNHKNLLDRLRKGRVLKRAHVDNYIAESSLSKDGYEIYFKNLEGVNGILIDRKKVFSKTISQRVWFYDSLGIQVSIIDDLWIGPDTASLVENYVYGNFIRIKFDDIKVIEWCLANKHIQIARDVMCSLSLVKNMYNVESYKDTSPSKIGDGLYVDARNTELFQWADNALSDQNLDIEFESFTISSYSLSALENILDYGKRNSSIMKIYGV